jgi:hypothetical protein
MFGILSVCLTTCIRKKKMAREDGMGGGLPKKKEKFDFPEKAFGAGKAPKKKRGAAKRGTKTGMADKKGKGPARTIAEAKRRGLSTFTDKSGKKKAAVTAEELKKSGLSLRDYLNKQQGKTRAAPKAPTTKPTSKPTRKDPLAGNKFLQASAKNVGKTRKTPVQVDMGSGKAAAPKKTPVQQPLGSGVRGNQPLGSGKRDKKDTSTPYMGFKAGGMKKGYKMGGMKKGYSMGGMKKKGYSMGGMRKKGFSAGKSVRGVGKATKGFRPVKMVMMTKGGAKGGKRS